MYVGYVFQYPDGTYYCTRGFTPTPTLDVGEAWVCRYKREAWLAWERDGKGRIREVMVDTRLVEPEETISGSN